MLYIIRHGKTDWNELHKLQGRTDIPLNESGRKMARDAGQRYKEINFDICFCSPLVRAKETAELLLEGRDVPIIEDDRLKEMSIGIYEAVENCFEREDIPVRTIFKEPEKYTEAFENAESALFVFELAAFVLARNNNAGWNVGDANCGFSFINFLSAGAT